MQRRFYQRSKSVKNCYRQDTRIEKIIFSPNWKDRKPENNNGSTKQIIKYQSLEQYEDALENIEIPQMKLEEFKDYFVKYMLEFETRSSNTFLNIDTMKDPFNYKLKIIDNYEPKSVSVDLVETYNYLIGLEVSKIRALENSDDSKRKYVTVQGKHEGKDIVVIWRSTKDLSPEKDRDFIKVNILKGEFGEVHINGDSLIEGAVLIEEQFKRIMNGG
jgi:adenine-specific DNA-methyltransferase